MGLILLRHTAPDVAPGTCYGRLDLPPGPGFDAEAEAIIAKLPEITRIVSSPLIRCVRLAEKIGAGRGLPLETDPRLIEIDFGRWEGTPWNAVPRDELDAWAADFYGARPHGGENVGTVIARVRSFLRDHREGRGCLAVTHAGIMRAVVHMAGQDDTWSCRFAYGETLVLSAEELGRF